MDVQVALPLCPHSYLDMRTLGHRVGVRGWTWGAMQDRPVGYFLDGHPLYGPMSEPSLDWVRYPVFDDGEDEDKEEEEGGLMVVGYGVDGFKIVATRRWPEEGELDECNGRFVKGTDGTYTYAYYLTVNETHARPPYALGCFGPGHQRAGGQGKVDYQEVLRGGLDTGCARYG